MAEGGTNLSAAMAWIGVKLSSCVLAFTERGETVAFSRFGMCNRRGIILDGFGVLRTVICFGFCLCFGFFFF